ncbi:LOW QUALITY PROTEIN: uncharacterized protein LOC132925584 [Rhopalosiphum padi]|uniref:LOW QUALITY PROTEIN: uncharacterized protein LOC132925584 n=1 Tax=Rhopalosiphum padi TaxID=40932 RepID=UPI00298E232A|nr:LOW QUALITY PROTEIN: uncharacterized protein LOC132925584 [Rhopalosiphum padi]
MRNKLVSVIIKDQIRSQVILNRSRFIILAKGIEELFPSETEETYFILYCKEGFIISPNRGKLYGKFCNIKKEMSKICNKKKTHLSSSDQEINLNHEDYKDSLTWLKNNIEPDVTLHKLWKATASYRLKDKNNNMLNTYIALSKPTGHIFIDIDFNYMYVGKEMSLFEKFPIFKEKLKVYLEIKEINISKSLIDKLIAPYRPGDDDIAVFQILPYLFQPFSIIVQKPPKNTRTIGASKIEQAAAFISNATNANDLKKVQSDKINKAFSLGLTVQPFVVFVGESDLDENISNNPLSFYTVVYETYYKVETILKAFDVCFKSFHTLNLKYRFEAEQVWKFIQEYFYKIPENRGET